MAGTREQVLGEIAEIASTHDAQLSSAALAAIANWHLSALQAARNEAWIPGTAEQSDPLVDELIRRFHLHGFKEKIIQLQERISYLADRQAKLIECARFYAAGPWDGGSRARSALEPRITPPVAREGRVGYTS